MKMWSCNYDDPRITELDPVRKLWMYNNWIADKNEEVELAKNHAYLVASFDHPDAVKKIVGDGNTIESDDKDFEESLEMVKNQSLNINKVEAGPKRKRRKIKKV